MPTNDEIEYGVEFTTDNGAPQDYSLTVRGRQLPRFDDLVVLSVGDGASVMGRVDEIVWQVTEQDRIGPSAYPLVVLKDRPRT